MHIDISLSQALIAGRVAYDVVLTPTSDGSGEMRGEIGRFIDDAAADRAVRHFGAGRGVAIVSLPLVEPDNADVRRETLGYLVYGKLSHVRTQYDLRIDKIRPLRTPGEYELRVMEKVTHLTTPATMAWLQAKVPHIVPLLKKRGCRAIIVHKCEFETWPTIPVGMLAGPDLKPIVRTRYRLQFCGLSSRDPAVVAMPTRFDNVVDTEDACCVYDVGPGDDFHSIFQQPLVVPNGS